MMYNPCHPAEILWEEYLSPQFWLTMQMNYDLFKVQKKSRKAIQAVRSVRWKTDKQKLAA